MPTDPLVLGTNPHRASGYHARGIREALKLWQEQHDVALAVASSGPPPSSYGDTQNLVTQSGEDESYTAIARDEEPEDDDPIDLEPGEPVPGIFSRRIFLRQGDLVELKWVSRWKDGTNAD